MPSPAAPPYSLPPHRFRFPALAARAGRAALGGERESALACLMAARVAAGALPPGPLPHAARAPRAGAARVWLGSLALPAGLRAPLTRLIEATGHEPLRDLGPPLRAVAEAATRYLDAPSRAELDRLADDASAAAARDG